MSSSNHFMSLNHLISNYEIYKLFIECYNFKFHPDVKFGNQLPENN